MKFPQLKSKLKPQLMIKIVLAFVYTVICTLIILPRIDHESWYPKSIGSTDLIPGINFTQHTRVSVPFTDIALETKQKNETIKILLKRLSFLSISDSSIQYKDDTLLIDLPGEYSDSTGQQLTEQGVISFLKSKEGVDFETNPMEMFNQESFEQTTLSPSDITSASVNNRTDQYTYIDLDISSSKLTAWSEFSNSNATGLIGLTIDGSQQPAWLLPMDSGAKKASLVLLSTDVSTDFIASYLDIGPLPTDLLTTTTSSVDPLYTTETLEILYAVLIGTFAVGIALRRIFLKETITTTIACACIVIGAVAILKLTSITFTIPFVIAMLALTAITCSIPTSIQMTAFIAVVLFSILLRLSATTSVSTVGQVGLIWGAFGLLSVFFYQFINIYEEE